MKSNGSLYELVYAVFQISILTKLFTTWITRYHSFVNFFQNLFFHSKLSTFIANIRSNFHDSLNYLKNTLDHQFGTSYGLEHVHLLVIKLVHHTFGFQLVIIYHWTNSNVFIHWWTNIKPNRASLPLQNYSSNWFEHHFFEGRTNSNVFIY